jgi:multidrug efflux pump subunit AcrA (membrane-fusion protein)
MNETLIQTQWLGRMQQEIGVLQTNLMLVNLQRDALLQKTQENTALIDALKIRCQSAEDANAQLKRQLQPHLQSRTHAVKRSIKTNPIES